MPERDHEKGQGKSPRLRIAYVAHIAPQSHGVRRKAEQQIRAWRDAGHEAEPFFIIRDVPAEKGVYPGWRRYDLLHLHQKLLSDVHSFQPTLLYLRDTLVSPFILLLLARYRKKIVLEINSNAFAELRLLSGRSFSDRRAYWIYKNTAKILHTGCMGFVAVTRELVEAPEYASPLPHLYSPNGIALNDIQTVKTPSADPRHHILFTGSPGQPWHGVDKLIRLAEILGEEYIFHIVGPVVEAVHPNIIAHGYRSAREIAQIAAGCDVGFGTLALHRKGMDEACPLKIREYLALGLPAITPYRDTAFLNRTPEWICPLPNSEDVFDHSGNIDRLRAFLKRHKSTVVTHDMCRDYIDVSVLEKKKLDAISSWKKI